MSAMKGCKLSGSFEVLVDYDDPKYHNLDPERYRFSAETQNVRAEPCHFKVRGTGKTKVIFGYLEYDEEVDTQTAWEEMQGRKGRSGIRNPDVAEFMAFCQTFPTEAQSNNLAGFCDAVHCRHDWNFIANIYAYDDTFSFWLTWYGVRKGKETRFLVVREQAA